MEALEQLMGTWSMSASLQPDDDPPRAATSFEWLEGRRFVIQRWRVDHPAAPDGIAIIGPGEDGGYRQHYFDSRGVERVYEMTLADGRWELRRDAEPPDFSQRFVGTFDDSGGSIVGAWEISHDGGATWEHDFDLVYRRTEP